MRKFLFLIFICILSCQKKSDLKVQSSDLTANQKKLAEWYNTSLKLQNKNNLLIGKYSDSLIKNSQNENDEFKSLGYISYGIYYRAINNDSLCFKNFNQALNLLKNSSRDSLLIRVHTGIGSYYKNTDNYPNSLKEFMKALSLAEKLNDSLKLGLIHANLGQLYYQKDDVKESKKHLAISINYLDHFKNTPPYLITLHTLANIYGSSGDINKALELDSEGLKRAEYVKTSDLKAPFLDNKANCFLASSKLDSANYYFNECLKIDIENKNERHISDSYANLAFLSVSTKNDSAVHYYTQKSIEIAKKVKSNLGVAKNYAILEDFYKAKGDYKKAFEYSQKYQLVYKNLINEKKEVATAEYRTIYESEKKEKELLKSKFAIQEKELQIKKKNTQFQILGLIIIALIAIGYLIYRQQKLKNKQQEQEFQLKSAISQIETQNQLHEQRISISRDLHDNIGAQLTFVISSVDNLKFGNKITDSRINNQLTKISDFTKSTIIELRDTIWAMNNNEFTFDDLRSRIFNFIEKAKIAKEDVVFLFSIDENLKDEKLSSIKGINIYRTIQEAINNAIKYSDAQKIEVNVIGENKLIKITIADNGNGFDHEKVELGNGLQNMKKRMQEINGKTSFDSKINEGTIITILI